MGIRPDAQMFDAPYSQKRRSTMPTLQQTELQAELPVPQPNPATIFDTLSRHQQTMALKGAIDLDLFTMIADGASTPEAIAIRCEASERGVRILCDFLTIHGFLRKARERYELTAESAKFLNRHSRAYLGDIAHFLVSPRMLETFRDIAGVVRKGGTLNSGCDTDDSARWVEFARWMSPAAELASNATAPLLAKPGTKQRVLDIAAGSGLYGISIARLNSDAEVVAVDGEAVLEVARENAIRAGVGDRYQTLSGDAFQVNLGSAYDLVLISNLLHMFDAESNIQLLRKVRAAVRPGGHVATIEFVPNEDRISPPMPASFSLVMLANTDAGDAYTLRELDRMFHAAGFGESLGRPIPPSPFTLILTEA
jgi:2-polyprenyl-3-methyl-5-hydroxy-6-metoxy-1,4-benzoquinol methylase